MSYIEPLLLQNTFNEWLVTINELVSEINTANSTGTPGALARYNSANSLVLEQIDLTELSMGGITANQIYTDFYTNNHHSFATSKAIYDLLTGGSALRLDLNVNSIEFDDGNKYSSVVQDFMDPADDYDQLFTANSMIDYLSGVRHFGNPLNLHTNSLTMGGHSVQKISKDFWTIDHTRIPTSQAVYDWLGGSGGPLPSIKLSKLTVGGYSVTKIANNFNTLDHDTLVTAKAINDYLGGLDDDIRTLEGISLRIQGHTIDSIRDDFDVILSNTLPTTLAVSNYLQNGDYTLNIQANTGTFDQVSTNTFFSNNIVANNNVWVGNNVTVSNNISSNTFTLANNTINSIALDIDTINDDTLPTPNAIHKFLGSGNVESVSANTLFTLAGYSVNTITYMIDAANTNNTTLATTSGIYNLLTGATASVPPLPITANTISFPGAGPGGNVVVNSIATDFTTINDNTLVTANAVYNLLTDLTLDAQFRSLRLQNGQVVNDIATVIDASTTNHNTLATTSGIKDYVDNAFTSGSAVIDAAVITSTDIETANLFAAYIVAGGVVTGESVGQQAYSAYVDDGYVEGPYMATTAIEPLLERDALGSAILLGSGGATGAGELGEAQTIKVIAGGTILTVNASGVFINGAPVVTS